MTRGDELLDALVTADRRRAKSVVASALAESADPAEVYADLIQETLYDVGRRWQTGALTVAQEHAATATVQYVLSALYADLPRTSGADKGSIVVAGVVGEMHQLGAHMVADVLDADGWRVRFLGAGVPTESLLSTLEAERPVLVMLSLTMPERLPQLAETVNAIRSRFGRSISIVVGGQGAAHADLTRLDIDAHATDVVAAREHARRLAA